MKFLIYVILFLSAAGLNLASGFAASQFRESKSSRAKWFNHGQHPVDAGVSTVTNLSVKSCRDCHFQQYGEWIGSRHAKAWTNPFFQEGYLVEKSNRCIFCHAPLKEQFFDLANETVSDLAQEGVNCVACHIRDNIVYGPRSESYLWHPLKKDEQLRSPQFCAGCHQFNVERSVNNDRAATSTNAQNTYQEWQIYMARGGTKTCQQCHMPGGAHTFRGSHEIKILKDALDLKIKENWGHFEFVISSKNVGHNYPTGDVFRHIQLEITNAKGEFEIVETFGKEYKMVVDVESGEINQVLIKNTSLEPFVPKHVRVARKRPFNYRLRYFYVSKKGLRTSHLSDDRLVKTLIEGEVQ